MITDLTLKGRAHASRSILFTPDDKYNIFILSAILFLLLLLPGCAKKEEPKKVSLLKRTEGPAEKVNSIQPGALRFGFDLRLDPKEEVMIYTSFLKYLENRTGRSFRIKFTEKHEDTVRNLGEGLTHFAAIGASGYISGKEKYGIKYLVSGVNKDGEPAYHSVIITRNDSGIHEISDLKGRSFAFGPAVSAQGYMIPRRMLEDSGVSLKDLRNYIYTDSHSDTLKAVLSGECDA
ncbi:MAG: PhnD/SsuA/transferrin family substrate-binding protein, partial [Nitrospirota bacterium]|nr:PhnD/SsuA/transferrin family substrate-binding protein [Nitrospirota bacterium]